MSKVATIDFELRSRLNVKDVGSARYASDPTTSVVCLCYEIDGGPVKLWVPDCFDDDPEDLLDHIRGGGIVEAHNVGFERSVWSEQMVKRYGFPEVPFENWDCTSARSSAVGLPPKLETLGNVLDLNKKKNMDGHSKMLSVARPKLPRKNDPRYFDVDPSEIVWNTKPEDLSVVYSYCKDDVRSERELSRVVPPLSEFERRVWLLDQKANDRGITIDRKAVDIILEKINEMEEENLPRFGEITDGEVTKPGQFAKIKQWINDQGVPIPNTQAETVESFLAKPDLPDDVRELLELRVMFGGAAVKKYKKMVASMGDDNRVRDTLVYCGAQRTGRWSGRRVQPQNLFRSHTSGDSLIRASFDALYAKRWDVLEIIYGDLMSAFASLTRSVLIPSPGFDMFVADFSSVETCFLFWIADDVDAVNDILAGRDVYKTMASTVFGKRYEDVDKSERQFGKKLILGLGYGMGPDTFIENCIAEGTDLDPEFIRNAVRLYREIHKPVVVLWRKLDRAFKKCLSTGQSVSVADGRLTLRSEGDKITLELPSGRRLYYWGARLVPRKKKFRKTKKVRDEKTGKLRTVADGFETKIVEVVKVKGVGPAGNFIWKETYGSKIVENLVQAGCRDLMSFSMLNVDAEGYSLLWTSHDEIISERPKGEGSLSSYCDIMSTPPKWYNGPINADGFRGDRYKKG